jgi:hypothetical protein
MKTHRQAWRRWARSSFFLFATLQSATDRLGLAVCAGQEIKIGRSVLVSTAHGQLNHSEVIIAADPSNPEHLLACSMVAPEQPSTDLYRNVAYVSFDDGANWSAELEFGGELWSADPFCTFGPNGRAYYAALVFDSTSGGWKGKTVLYASPEAGKTWSLIATLPQGDREFLTVDNLKNRLYAVETVASASLTGGVTEPLVVYVSDDQGKSFQTRAVLSGRGEKAGFGYPGVVLPEGTFAAGFSAFPAEANEAKKHAEGSDSSPGKVRVLLYNGSSENQLAIPAVDDLYECDTWANSAPMPSLGVDSSNGLFHGRLYVAWPDSRSGRCEILFSLSTDAGKTWSKPTIVNDDQPRAAWNSGPDNFHPVVAVSPKGVVGILWYDRRDSPDNLGWRPRFTASLDGGQTFLPSADFGDSRMDFLQGDIVNLEAKSEGGGSPPFRSGGAIHTSLGFWGHGLTGGETAGLTADASGAFHALWIDNRTGSRQVWTARIFVEGAVTKNGSADLAALEDVSGEVAVFFLAPRLDRQNHVVTANAYLQNTSNSSLNTPLMLRVLELTSKIGTPRFTNADNHQGGSGALYDFTPLVLGGTLQPGQRSGVRQIVIDLDHLSPGRRTGDYDALFDVIRVKSVVLGPHRSQASQLKRPAR